MTERPVRCIGVMKPGRPAILDDVEPELGPGQAWVRTEWSGISAGTEVALVRGTDPHHRLGWDPELGVFGGTGTKTRYPVRRLGYMEVGRITESRTDALAEGALVAMAYGHRTGRCADPTIMPVIPLPEDLDPLLGVYLAQMGPICVNGLLHATAALAGPPAGLGDGGAGRFVLVTGAGVIGLLSALLAVRHGAAATWPRTALAAVTLDLLRQRGDDVRTHLITDVLPFEEGPRLLTALAERRLASPPLQAVLRMPPA